MMNQLLRTALYLFAVLMVAPLGVCQETSSKSDLRVLLVSHDPANIRVPFADMEDERTVALYAERAELFETLLREHFTHVKMVYGGAYTASMSDEVDVTLFDSRPKELIKSKRVKDPVSGEMDYRLAEYLPRNFDRPALMIAESSPTIGEPLGLKLDWL
jgi:hypothetical protein